MVSKTQAAIRLDKRLSRIEEQNDAILELLESRLPKKKKPGRPKNNQVVIDVEEIVLPVNKTALEASKVLAAALKEKLDQSKPVA